MVCSENELRLVELFTFPVETKSFRKVKLVNLHGAARLRLLPRKKLYRDQKQLLHMLEMNFERILHNTEYV